MSQILVIGAGVSGLTCALVLAREGHEVSIWAKDLTENTTSAVAAAYWAPYMCNPVEKVIEWSRYTKAYFKDQIMTQQSSGVLPLYMTEFFDNEGEEPWWRDAVEGGEHLDISELPDGYKSGFKAHLLLIDTSIYLPWLVQELGKLGVATEQKMVSSFSSIPDKFEVIVNCTGLGARELCKDEKVFPIRGQVIKVVKSSDLNQVIADDTAHNSLAYIIPRVNDVVLGGTAQPNDWNLEVDVEDTKTILRKAKLLFPNLGKVKVISENVGLRPSRDEVRLEVEKIDDRTVIHNYGHGGAGLTLSWGCANEVLNLVTQL